MQGEGIEKINRADSPSPTRELLLLIAQLTLAGHSGPDRPPCDAVY